MRTYSSRAIHTHPTGYHEGQYGPFKPARVIEFGAARRELTDRDSGEWRGGKFSARVADLDHSLKTALTAHPAFGRGVLARSYIVSIDGGRTGVDPWPWYAGPLLSWSVDRQGALALEFGDQVAQVLGGLVVPDRKLPKRRITLVDFPNAPQASLDLPVPIVYWSHRTDAGLNGLPLVYVGTRVMSDAATWHEWVLAGHAIHRFDFLNVNNANVAGWGTSWAMPGQAGWAAVTGSSAPYRDYNGRRYACVFGKGAQADSVAAGESKLQLECYGIEQSAAGVGVPISSIGQQILHCWVNWIIGDYQGGAWLPMPTYTTGWAQIDASSFALIDTLALARLPGVGYLGTSLYFGIQHPGTDAGAVTDDSRTIRETIGDIARSADIRIGLNQYSQWAAWMLPDSVVDADLAVFSPGDQQRPARILADSWNTDAAFDGQWTRLTVLANRAHVLGGSGNTSPEWGGTEVYIDDALESASSGLGAQIAGPTLELPFTSNFNATTLGAQAEDIGQRVLARHAVPIRTFTWETTRCGASYTDVGAIVGLTHYAYPGTRRIWLEVMETSLSKVLMSGWDVTDIVPGGSP